MSFKNELMTINFETIHNLKISKDLLSFVNNDLLKDINISPEKFWLGFDEAVHELAPKNKELLEIRKTNQPY